MNQQEISKRDIKKLAFYQIFKFDEFHKHSTKLEARIERWSSSPLLQ